MTGSNYAVYQGGDRLQPYQGLWDGARAGVLPRREVLVAVLGPNPLSISTMLLDLRVQVLPRVCLLH
jgi:hypothetical protein